LADLSADLRSRWRDPFARQAAPVARVPRGEVAKAHVLDEERRQGGEEAERREKESANREARVAARTRG
jgi:hypothetical protein